MSHLAKMFGRMLVLRAIAAADVAATQAHPEVNPGVAHCEAFRTSFAARSQVEPDRVEMGTGLSYHGFTASQFFRTCMHRSNLIFGLGACAVCPIPVRGVSLSPAIA